MPRPMTWLVFAALTAFAIWLAVFLFAPPVPVSGRWSFTASNFSPDDAPIQSVSGTFALTYDASASGEWVTDQPLEGAALTIGDHTFALSEVGFSYKPDRVRGTPEALAIGGLINGAHRTGEDGPDFLLIVEFPSTTRVCRSFTYRLRGGRTTGYSDSCRVIFTPRP